MELFSRPDADAINLAVWPDGLSHIQQLHAWNFRNKNFTAMHLLDAADYESHTLIERDPETRHARIGDRDPSPLALFQEDWNHTAAAADYVPITHATEARVLRASVRVSLHKHFLGA